MFLLKKHVQEHPCFSNFVEILGFRSVGTIEENKISIHGNAMTSGEGILLE